jgi:hypothetical protein
MIRKSTPAVRIGTVWLSEYVAISRSSDLTAAPPASEQVAELASLLPEPRGLIQ